MAEKLSTVKGFPRLAADVCAAGLKDVRLGTGSQVFSGTILEVEGGVITFESLIDRFNSETVYIPLERVHWVAVPKAASAKK